MSTEITGVDFYNLSTTGGGVSMTIRGAGGRDQTPHIIIVEHHPNDSRTKIADDQSNVQSLTQRMGTGGGQCASDNGER